MSKSFIREVYNRHPVTASIAGGVLVSALAGWALVAADHYYIKKYYGDVVSCDLGGEGEVTPAVSFKGTGPRACQSLVKAMQLAADYVRQNGSQQVEGVVSRVRMHTANGGQRFVYVVPDGFFKAPRGVE